MLLILECQKVPIINHFFGEINTKVNLSQLDFWYRAASSDCFDVVHFIKNMKDCFGDI